MESDRSISDSADVSLEDAKPYRSPADVSQQTTRRGLGAPVAWLILGFVVVGCLGSLAVFRFHARQDADNNVEVVSDYVREFGGARTAPLEEDDVWRAEADLAAQAMTQSR